MRWRRRNALRSLDDDIRDHIQREVEENIARGMTPEDARRQALLKFGNVALVHEDARAVWGWRSFDEVRQDVRVALRALRRSPGFAAVAVMTLALGIGANTAIFSVVNDVLFAPLAYPDSDRLVLVWERNTSIGKDRDPVAPPNYLDWRASSTVFADLGAYRFDGFALSGHGDPEQVRALEMSSSVFDVLAVDALLGRTFSEAEERRREPLLVLQHDFWRRRFGGNNAIVGQAVRLDGVAFTVIGVMPPGFAFPDGDTVDIYVPLVFRDDELTGRRLHTLTVIGRLEDGVTADNARAELDSIARSIAALDPTSNPEVAIVGAQDLLVEDVRLGLIVLLATVGFVLLIACANVATLLLVRAVSRRGEMAVRSALGASPPRLVRQLLTESTMLALLGGFTGVAVAWLLLSLFVRVRPPDLARVSDIGIDATVLLFALGVTTLTGVGFGLAPALRLTRLGAGSAIDRDRHAAATAFPPSLQLRRTGHRHPAHSSILVAQIALSLMLFAGAGLLIRSLANMQRLDLGFRPEGVLTAQIDLSAGRYPLDPAQFRPKPAVPTRVPDSKPSAFFVQLEEHVRALPGVQAVGAVSSLPLNPVGMDYDLPVIVEGRPRPRPGEELQADFRIATTGYVEAMGIPLLRGRPFNAFDGPNGTPVIIINDTMAREVFGNADPLGERIVLYGRPREIIGVVGSVRHSGFSRDPRPEMIVPHRQFHMPGGMTLVVRSHVESAGLAAALTRTVHALDPEQPVYRVRPMEAFLSESVAQPRFTTALLAGFAALALVMAFVGLYGSLSFSVSRRTREIGVRMALGADRREVVWMVVRQAIALAGTGVIVGLIGAALGTTLMAGLLFGVSATDPLTFAAAATTLILTSIAAACVPARRAATVAPMNALRAE